VAARSIPRQCALQYVLQKTGTSDAAGKLPFLCINFQRAVTDSRTERTRILRPHQEIPRRSHRILNAKPSPRLLRREDRKRGRLQTVVERSESIQPQEGQDGLNTQKHHGNRFRKLVIMFWVFMGKG
jgi:hypothetical protein